MRLFSMNSKWTLKAVVFISLATGVAGGVLTSFLDVPSSALAATWSCPSLAAGCTGYGCTFKAGTGQICFQIADAGVTCKEKKCTSDCLDGGGPAGQLP